MGKDYIIIVAGGKGLRMGGEVPKQFLPVGGVPVLMRTIMRFREALPGIIVVLVLPKSQQDYWLQLCREYNFPAPLPVDGGAGGEGYLLADGGQTRFHSVQSGLALVPDDAEGVVGVHDGVRPFVSVEVIRRCYEEARIHKAVVPVVPVVETLRKMEHQSSSKTVPRDDYRLVQTPQCFDVRLLKDANKQPYTDAFTDDASVVESYGQAITLVEGNRENIKITTPFDLKIAEAILRS